MVLKEMRINFGEFNTKVHISGEVPAIHEIAFDLGIKASFKPLIIADENTAPIAGIICGGSEYPCCILKSGEEHKTWHAIETILATALKAGLGRDGVFIAVGGGVISDLAGFAASIYMRGCRFVLVSTTLLGMVDASVGGKTGFDLFEIKNLAGSFYPAETVYLPAAALSTLPEKEWKSGMAELIKTAILAGDEFLDQLIINRDQLIKIIKQRTANKEKLIKGNDRISIIHDLIERAVAFKSGIVSEDFREAENGKRKLLNLGHTFAHALESAAGLGRISHGEAVAWGIVQACKLGIKLGITPEARAEKITDLIEAFGYESAAPHPLAGNAAALLNAMNRDKKKKRGEITFITPDENSARSVTLAKTELNLIENILNGSN